ncbi:MAG: AAA family ATPase [Anaerolineae bacterium]
MRHLMKDRPGVSIHRLEVRNYRSLAEVSLELSPLTVLVGPNGSGKSNIVDVLRFISDAMNLGLDSAIGKRGCTSTPARWPSSVASFFRSARKLRSCSPRTVRNFWR